MDKIDFVNSQHPALNDENLNLMQDNIERAINAQVAGDTLPIGAILPFSGLNIPENWLVCDGRAVSRTEYAQLYAVIGRLYGPGDGSTTFNLPDLRGRVPVGVNESDLDLIMPGITGGEKKHKLTIDEMPKHNHNFNLTGDAYSQTQILQIEGWSWKNTYQQTGSLITDTGNSEPHNIMQPYITQSYIIKAFQSSGVVAQVTNTKNTSTTNVYSCNYINKEIDQIKNQGDYIQATTTIATNLSSGTKIKLNSLMYIKGNSFTLDSVNNQIVVGEGVSKVEISASIFAENTGSTGYIWAIIKLANKGNVISAIHPAGDDWGFLSSTVPSSVVAVNEGDRIELIADSTTGGINRTGGLNVWLYVKALE